MKKFSLLLLCLSAATCLAQNVSIIETPPGVTIRKYRWQQVGPGPSVDASWKAESDSVSTSSSTSSDESSSFAVRRGPYFVYSLEIQNDGAKPIKAIRWNYTILDSKTNEELGTHDFENFDRVGRNKSKSLTAKSRVTPTRVVPIQVTDKSSTVEKVLVRCIVYEDDTVWQKSGVTHAECDALRRRSKN